MMTTERYQGWKNHATWALALHIDNDQGSYTLWHDTADVALAEHGGDVPATTEALAAGLKDAFEEGKDELLQDAKQVNSVWADLLNAALEGVDWYELAEHYVEDAVERAAK